MRKNRLRRGQQQGDESSLAKPRGSPRDPQPLANALDSYSLRERIEPVTTFGRETTEQAAHETGTPAGASTFADLGSRVAGVLEAAEAEARKLLEDAQAEAERLRQHSAEELEGRRARAEQLREEAETYVARIREEAEADADERRRAAQADAARIQREAKQLYARAEEQALERRRELEESAHELENWLRAVLVTMHDTAGQLETALAPIPEPGREAGEDPQERVERPEAVGANRSAP